MQTFTTGYLLYDHGIPGQLIDLTVHKFSMPCVDGSAEVLHTCICEGSSCRRSMTSVSDKSSQISVGIEESRSCESLVWRKSVYTCVHIYIYIYATSNQHVHIYIYIYTYIYIYKHINTYIYTYIYTHIHIHIYIYIYNYIYTDIYIYIYI